MKIENLGELNKLCNIRDTIILSEIFESRASYLNKKFKYNPRKCNSVSSFSRCVHQDKSKYCIALPTDWEIVKLFKRILIGGFNSINTCYRKIKVSHTDKTGHLFIVDIKFYLKNKKVLLFNEFCTPIFEKSKLTIPYERSVLKLLSVLSGNEGKDIINTFKHNAKSHSTVKEKIFISLYVEHWHFLVTRAGWLVTKIYEHFTFEQSPSKKEFVTMNQNAMKETFINFWTTPILELIVEIISTILSSSLFTMRLARSAL